MLNTIFKGIFDTQYTELISVSEFLICLGGALVIGLVLGLCYTYRNRYTKSFLATLALLPAIVCVVIMMVNGNVGAGVAVAGAFSLIRFRSVPGTAREIGASFMAMCAGLIAGMGYAVLFTLVLCGVMMLYSRLDFGSRKNAEKYKVLRITVPEDLDYQGAFDEVLGEYTSSHELVQVKTTNMGSLFRLTYEMVLNGGEAEKDLIDKLRCRNGNLEISISRRETVTYEL